jgi:hypothetical protein
MEIREGISMVDASSTLSIRAVLFLVFELLLGLLFVEVERYDG